MSGSRVIRFSWVVVWFLSTTSAGQGDPQDRSSVESETKTPRIDVEEVAEALEILAEAGVPPTREELAGFLGTGDPAGPRLKVARSPFPVHGLARIRCGLFQDDEMDHAGKFALETRWVRMRVRIRKYRTGVMESTGTLEVGEGAVELRLGELGLSQGHGLLLGRPGRGSSLAADSGFGSPGERLVSWLGATDSRVLSGIAGRVRYGNWNLRFLKSIQVEFNPRPARPVSAVQLGFHGKGQGVSVAGLVNDAGRGGSLAGRLMKRPLFGSFEAVVWQADPGNPATGAGVLQMGWSPLRGTGVEAMLGFADQVDAPGLAQRPAVLSGWDGRGFALRGYTRTESHVVLRALVHMARHLDRTGIRRRKEKILVDLQASMEPSPGIHLAVRYRSTDARDWSWSQRFPWEPPLVNPSSRRTIISVQVGIEGHRSRGRLLVRSYGLGNETGGRRRSLISLTGRYVVSPAWKIRGTWVTAWGDPVDLVSAIIPMTGMVLPRHWGRWRSETLTGLEWTRGKVRVQVACSWRNPEIGTGERGARTIWAEAGIGW